MFNSPLFARSWRALGPLLVVAGLAMSAAACESTNECGQTIEPGTDGVLSQDPSDPDIVAACQTFCQALESALPGCAVSNACVETCKQSSCDVCPGTLAPLENCKAQNLAPAQCTCEPGGPVCPLPAECTDESNALTACGG